MPAAGPNKDCKKHAAAKVSARAGHAGQSEVDHLGGEYERTHNPHKWQPIVARSLSGATSGHGHR